MPDDLPLFEFREVRRGSMLSQGRLVRLACCPLCGAMVLEDAVDRHVAWHGTLSPPSEQEARTYFDPLRPPNPAPTPPTQEG